MAQRVRALALYHRILRTCRDCTFCPPPASVVWCCLAGRRVLCLPRVPLVPPSFPPPGSWLPLRTHPAPRPSHCFHRYCGCPRGLRYRDCRGRRPRGRRHRCPLGRRRCRRRRRLPITSSAAVAAPAADVTAIAAAPAIVAITAAGVAAAAPRPPGWVLPLVLTTSCPFALHRSRVLCFPLRPDLSGDWSLLREGPRGGR